jgi:hypothetical protein
MASRLVLDGKQQSQPMEEDEEEDEEDEEEEEELLMYTANGVIKVGPAPTEEDDEEQEGEEVEQEQEEEEEQDPNFNPPHLNWVPNFNPPNFSRDFYNGGPYRFHHGHLFATMLQDIGEEDGVRVDERTMLIEDGVLQCLTNCTEANMRNQNDFYKFYGFMMFHPQDGVAPIHRAPWSPEVLEGCHTYAAMLAAAAHSRRTISCCSTIDIVRDRIGTNWRSPLLKS